MPFEPIRILILIDDTRGYCSRVVPRMKDLLRKRAFQVDVHRIQDGPVDIDAYKGIILGSPCFGLAIKGVGPTEELVTYVQTHMPDLEEHGVAVFCVYEARPGLTLDRMKGLVKSCGGTLVAAHGYQLLRMRRGEHVIPTECMVRIR